MSMPVEPIDPPPTIIAAIKLLGSAIKYKFFPKYYKTKMSEVTKKVNK